LCPFRLEV